MPSAILTAASPWRRQERLRSTANLLDAYDLIALNLKLRAGFRPHDLFSAGRDDAQAHRRQVKIALDKCPQIISKIIWVPAEILRSKVSIPGEDLQNMRAEDARTRPNFNFPAFPKSTPANNFLVLPCICPSRANGDRKGSTHLPIPRTPYPLPPLCPRCLPYLSQTIIIALQNIANYPRTITHATPTWLRPERKLTMSEENMAVIRRFYAELDKGNFDIYDELCTPGYISHFPGSPQPQDRETRKQTSRMFYAAIPDLVHTLEDMIAVGNKVAMRGSARGTHTRAFRDLPPTGNPVMFTGMRFYRMLDGKIAEEWASFDSLALMQQLGVIPAPGESAERSN
jgi:predicted ester cyclase